MKLALDDASRNDPDQIEARRAQNGVQIPDLGHGALLRRAARLRAVVEDDGGTTWIGTREFGLLKYDGESFAEVSVRN